MHRSEQYFTSFHTFAHFFRHANSRPQRSHGFEGKSALAVPFGIDSPREVIGDVSVQEFVLLPAQEQVERPSEEPIECGKRADDQHAAAGNGVIPGSAEDQVVTATAGDDVATLARPIWRPFTVKAGRLLRMGRVGLQAIFRNWNMRASQSLRQKKRVMLICFTDTP